MTLTTIEPSLYFKFEDNQLIGIDGSYSDILLRARVDKWQILANAALERFETTRNEQPPLILAGMNLPEVEDMLPIDQDFYLKKIEQFLIDVVFSELASTQIKLDISSECHTRLGLLYLTNCSNN